MDAPAPKLIIFDFDGTLAANKQPLEHRMAMKLGQLLERMPIGVVSVGGLPHLLKMVVSRIPESADLSRLYLLPASGGALYEYRSGGWDKVFEERISEKDAPLIEKALREGAEATGFVSFIEAAWGERFEHRGAQIALLTLGAEAPFSEKYVWDPDRSKRQAILRAVSERLPDGYHAFIGGTATIAVSKIGIDKAYGVRQLCLRLRIPEHNTLYVGDELYEEGNDESVLHTNAQVRAIQSPADTARVIVSLLAS